MENVNTHKEIHTWIKLEKYLNEFVTEEESKAKQRPGSSYGYDKMVDRRRKTVSRPMSSHPINHNKATFSIKSGVNLRKRLGKGEAKEDDFDGLNSVDCC